MKKIIVIALVLISVVSIYCISTKKIDYGYIGVKYNTKTGEISECKGRVMYNPITTNLYIYPEYLKKIDCDPVVLATSNGDFFKIYLSLSYKIDSVTSFFKNRLCIVKMADMEHLPEILPESIEDFEKNLSNRVWFACYRAATSYPLDSLFYYSTNFEHDVDSVLNLLAKEEHISLSSIQINYLPPLSWRELHKAERELKNAAAALIKAQQEYELVHNKSMN